LQGRDPWDITFNYLGQLDAVVGDSLLFTVAPESGGRMVSEHQISAALLSINSFVANGELNLHWNYSLLHFRPETIANLADDFKGQLAILIANCLEQLRVGTVATPADYGLGNDVSNDELDRFFKDGSQEDIISF
jgi:non-ribosomal peptide synthase protein (TIGR01720 family)